MTVIIPSEFIARIACRQYVGVGARGQRRRATFSKPSLEDKATEDVEQLISRQNDDAAVAMIAFYAPVVVGLP